VRCRFDRVSAFTVARAPHRPDVNGLTVTLIVFDAVAVAGADLRAAPWSERRARLEELLSDATARCASRRCSSSTPRFMPPWSPTAGRSRWPSAPAGRYRCGHRSNAWVKLKSPAARDRDRRRFLASIAA
jgi:ATP-dependent DNA ligase